MEKLYATATGIYAHADFDGPPPMPHQEVYSAEQVDRLVKTLRDYLALRSLDGRPERQALRDQLTALSR